MPLALLLLFGGFLFVRSAMTGEHPLNDMVTAFGGDPLPRPGHGSASDELNSLSDTSGGPSSPKDSSPKSNRSKRDRSNKGGVGGGNYKGSGRVIMTGQCQKPSNLASKGNVTLQKPALDAFEKAEVEAGNISVVSSYRTCEQSVSDCHSICGKDSCPGTCAGVSSYHNKGLAIDLGSGCNSSKVRSALQKYGWCNFGASDHCHFSFNGCH